MCCKKGIDKLEFTKGENKDQEGEQLVGNNEDPTNSENEVFYDTITMAENEEVTGDKLCL